MWLIGTETSMWDDRGLVQSWLEAVGTRVNEAHYVLVDVYQYAK